jgi:hypothetical protein
MEMDLKDASDRAEPRDGVNQEEGMDQKEGMDQEEGMDPMDERHPRDGVNQKDEVHLRDGAHLREGLGAAKDDSPCAEFEKAIRSAGAYLLAISLGLQLVHARNGIHQGVRKY